MAMAQILRPNSADEVVKLNKMCERFPSISRENVLNILNLVSLCLFKMRVVNYLRHQCNCHYIERYVDCV